MTSRAPVPSSLKGDFFWNTAWSIMVAASTVVMLLAVTRSAGLAAGGVFSIALAIGQQFQTLGMYEVRTYHVTDVEGRFSFGDYLSARFLTVGAMAIGILVLSGVRGSSPADCAALALIASLKLFDAFEDVFYSELQRSGRLALAGRAGFIRSFVTTACFTALVFATKDLLVSALVCFIVSLATMLLVFIPPSRRVFRLRPHWSGPSIRSLMLACLPLFLASFIAMYLANAPRFAIDHFLDRDQQGYFAIIFMPAFAINLASTIVFRPLLTGMASIWLRRDLAAFRAIIGKGLAATAGAFLLVALVTDLFGGPILGFVFDKDVSAFRWELLILVLGGAMNSASVILYYALTTMRLQRLVFVGYLVSAAVVSAALLPLVPSMGLLGAAIGYALAMTVLALFFLTTLLIGVKKATRG